MAYDTKRLQTFKWLEKIAAGKAGYCKGVYNSIHDICVFCGSIYATNGILLVKLDYPEFEHLSDYTWSKVTRFCDDYSGLGLLLEVPEIEERQPFKDDRIFDKMFINVNEPTHCTFNPRVIEDALKVFKINGSNVTVSTSRNMMEFSGHTKDISIRCLIMGMR